MEARLFNKEQDYSIVLDWWTKRNQAPAPIDFLSDYGVIVTEGGKPVSCIWFYPVLSAKFGVILGPICNPDTEKNERDMALNLSLTTIHLIAKDMGYTTVLCVSNVGAFHKRLETFGYIPGDQNATLHWGGL